MTMKDTDNPANDNKFNSVSRSACGHKLSDSTKNTHLMKILPAVYTDCVTVANSQAQQQGKSVACNKLLEVTRAVTMMINIPPPLILQL